MNLSKIRVVIVDDNMYKRADIQGALEFNGVGSITAFANQEEVWREIYRSREANETIDLIVTDMQYPLAAGASVDVEAGFKLIERMKKEKIDIPIIICSSINYNVSEVLGCVWYNRLRDIEFDFGEILERLEEWNK